MKPHAWAWIGVCALYLFWGSVRAGAAEESALPGSTVVSAQHASGEEGSGGSGGPGRRIGGVFGGGPGLKILGSSQRHDIVLGSVSRGWVLGGKKEGWTRRGAFEPNFEVLAGSQVDPATRYLVGLTPHLRYHFPSSGNVVPFADLGAGVTVTNIHGPDLGNYFQFNLQGCGGVNVFRRSNLAVSLEARFLHLSSKRLSLPNLGVNAVLLMIGVSRFD